MIFLHRFASAVIKLKPGKNRFMFVKYPAESNRIATNLDCERPCSVTESLIQSLREMMLMRQGKIKKITWDEYKKSPENFTIEDIHKIGFKTTNEP